MDTLMKENIKIKCKHVYIITYKNIIENKSNGR